MAHQTYCFEMWQYNGKLCKVIIYMWGIPKIWKQIFNDGKPVVGS